MSSSARSERCSSRPSPTVVAVERVYFQTNVRTAMSVGQASGVVMAEAINAGCEVAQYGPNEVKQAVAGWGGAGKDEIERMVQRLLGIDHPLRPVDAADAVALALCHLAHAPTLTPDRSERGEVIGSLRGRLLDRSEDEVLVEVNGIGYRVTVVPATVVALGDVGDDVLVHMHHHVREDAQTLYGFASVGERRCFEALLGAHGVGPALALAILSVHSPEALQRTLADDDIASLCLVPGVGKKTAARLLVELKSRLSAADVDLTSAVIGANGNGSVGRRSPSVRADVRDALTGLGYAPDEIRDALADVPDEGDVSLLLKQALQRLALVRR